VVVVRDKVGKLGSIDGEKGTVKFEVAVTGGTRTWTNEYTVLRIHRGTVSLRARSRRGDHRRHPPEHCVRFAVIYGWRREGKRREKRERRAHSHITT
jgi:hypothetical protein